MSSTTPAAPTEAGPKFPRSALVSLTVEQDEWLRAHVEEIETSKSWVLRRGYELYRAEYEAKQSATG